MRGREGWALQENPASSAKICRSAREKREPPDPYLEALTSPATSRSLQSLPQKEELSGPSSTAREPIGRGRLSLPRMRTADLSGGPLVLTGLHAGSATYSTHRSKSHTMKPEPHSGELCP